MKAVLFLYLIRLCIRNVLTTLHLFIYNNSVKFINVVNEVEKMSSIQRRENQKDLMKKNIIDATICIIEEEGYEKLSLRKIAARIDYTPTTIYLYYKDKAEIITDMVNTLYQRVMIDVDNGDNSLSLIEQIRIHMHGFVRSLCSEPEMAKAIMSSGSNFIFTDTSDQDTPINPGIQRLDEILLKGVNDCIFKPCVANTSWMFISALLGFVMSAISSQLYLRKDFEQSIDDFVDILIDGISL